MLGHLATSFPTAGKNSASLQVLYSATWHLRPHFGIVKRAHPNKFLIVFPLLPCNVMVCKFSENLTKTSVGYAISRVAGVVTNCSFACVILFVWDLLALDNLYVFWVLVYSNLVMGWTTEKLVRFSAATDICFPRRTAGPWCSPSHVLNRYRKSPPKA
jgi:hypothetical protein